VVFADRIMMCVEIIVRLTRRPSKKIEIFHNLIESHELKASLLQTLDNCRKGRYRLRAITAAIVQDDDTSVLRLIEDMVGNGSNTWVCPILCLYIPKHCFHSQLVSL